MNQSGRVHRIEYEVSIGVMWPDGDVTHHEISEHRYEVAVEHYQSLEAIIAEGCFEVALDYVKREGLDDLLEDICEDYPGWGIAEGTEVLLYEGIKKITTLEETITDF